MLVRSVVSKERFRNMDDQVTTCLEMSFNGIVIKIEHQP